MVPGFAVEPSVPVLLHRVLGLVGVQRSSPESRKQGVGMNS